MKLKTGDKVRFLNERIEGVITQLLSNERVEVMDSDGFRHVADIRKLVLVELVLEEIDIRPVNEQETIISPKVSERIPITTSQIIKSLEPDNTIYAAIRLMNEKSPLTTDIELHLINNLQLSLCFTISRKHDDERSGIGAGIAPPRTEYFIGIFSQDELHRFDGFEFQFLFFGQNEFKPRPPAIKTLQFSSSDFLNADYRKLFYQKDDTVLLLPLHSQVTDENVNISKLLAKFKKDAEEESKRNVQSSKKEKAQKFTVLTRQQVVDLHIEELVKDHATMSNSQIISYQINYFMYEMDQALIKKLHKITFIHGVGAGVLRSAIREELKRFPNIKFRDAPQEKFGYGATEVEFF